MGPDKMRHCMSLGYSLKSKIANTIGQCKTSDTQTRGCELYVSLSLHCLSKDFTFTIFRWKWV